MAYRVPTFNISCAIWRNLGIGKVYAAPDDVTDCALSPGRRSMLLTLDPAELDEDALAMELLLPKLTDVRASWNAAGPDLVEVPTGTHRFYQVGYVDDVAKGYANEYRIALLAYLPAGAAAFGIAAPVPLP